MNADVVVIGAGSVGVAAAFFLAEAGLRVAVFDGEASAGRGENRAAIGGIRATHSDPAKISLGQEALRIFAGWEARTGDGIGWRQGGYTFVAMDDAVAAMLQDLVTRQRAWGLDIAWHGPDTVQELVPGIRRDGLRGGTFSPGDGSASPLLYAHSFHRQAEARGASFSFGEPVVDVRVQAGRVTGVRTTRREVSAPRVILAAGAHAREVGRRAGLDLPVVPDAHEGGITEPVERFLEPMVVDVRPAPGSRNYYFYQNSEGQVVFCITPDPPVVGTDRRATSSFLPLVARRMVDLVPRLAHLKVRRTWRGLYPMTPDGAPLVGPAPEVAGLFLAVGMCGQGFMLGPAVGALLARRIIGAETAEDRQVLHDLRPHRSFGPVEALK